MTPPCLGCGACCRDEIPVEADEDVPLEMTVESGGQRRMKPHAVAPWCGALDLASRTCTVYDRRPQICRGFERGSRSCARAIAIAPAGKRE